MVINEGRLLVLSKCRYAVCEEGVGPRSPPLRLTEDGHVADVRVIEAPYLGCLIFTKAHS